jgi:hypothetical protein
VKKFSLICALIFLAACQPKESVETAEGNVSFIRKYYPNGQLKAEVQVEFNRRNGLARSFYEDGSLRQSIEYLNGLKHGEARTYYENGNLFMVSRYKHNQLHGIRERYHPNGQLMSEAPFFEDKPTVGLREYLLDGTPRKYYPIIVVEQDGQLASGQLRFKVSLSDGTKRVKYFAGRLHPEGYIDRADELETHQEGETYVNVELPRDRAATERISLIAEVKTLQGNTYVVSHEHHVAANFITP